MIRTARCIGILVLGCLLLSCATWDKLEGTTPEEKAKFKMTKDQLWDAYKRYEAENMRLQGQIEVLKEEISRSDTHIGELQKEIHAMKNENTGLSDEKKALEDKIAEYEKEESAETAEAPEPKATKPVDDLKIKVLGGDGTLKSANLMAGQLREMGYRVEQVNLAPNSNFSRNTVFYEEGLNKEAEDLVARIGGNTISKALTWESIFDLIVVTGKK